jgi:hypothetical protein
MTGIVGIKHQLFWNKRQDFERNICTFNNNECWSRDEFIEEVTTNTEIHVRCSKSATTTVQERLSEINVFPRYASGIDFSRLWLQP